jgi:hypothetical protein
MIDEWAGTVSGWVVMQLENHVPAAASLSRLGVISRRPFA